VPFQGKRKINLRIRLNVKDNGINNAELVAVNAEISGFVFKFWGLSPFFIIL